MTLIEDNINALVKSIKNEDEFKEYTFVKGFSSSEFPNPLKGCLIAVSTLDTQADTQFLGQSVGENLKGSIVNVTVKFRVYAEKNAGGDGLLQECCILCDVIRRCDKDKACEDIKISSISFDNDANTVYRDVVAQLSFCMYEEVSL